MKITIFHFKIVLDYLNKVTKVQLEN